MSHIVDKEASRGIDRTRQSIAGLKLRDVAQHYLIYLYLQVRLSSRPRRLLGAKRQQALCP